MTLTQAYFLVRRNSVLRAEFINRRKAISKELRAELKTKQKKAIKDLITEFEPELKKLKNPNRRPKKVETQAEEVKYW